mgnify:CR=1 FL=1
MGIYSLYATVPWYHRGYHPVHPVVLPLLLVPGGEGVLYVYPRTCTQEAMYPPYPPSPRP